MKNNLFLIAKEGWKFIGFSFLALLIFSALGLESLNILSFVAILFFAFVFRNPERETPSFQENSLVSPVDGVIVSIEELSNSEYAYEVKIDSGYFDVSVLRAPLSASVKVLHIQKGAKLSDEEKLAQKINEKAEIIFEDKESNKVKIEHLLKRSFDDIQIGIAEAQNISQGSRYGVMVDGVTSIFLPQNFRLNIAINNRVKGSETLIGYFS